MKNNITLYVCVSVVQIKNEAVWNVLYTVWVGEVYFFSVWIYLKCLFRYFVWYKNGRLNWGWKISQPDSSKYFISMFLPFKPLDSRCQSVTVFVTTNFMFLCFDVKLPQTLRNCVNRASILLIKILNKISNSFQPVSPFGSVVFS